MVGAILVLTMYIQVIELDGIRFEFDPVKNDQIKALRGIGFEDVAQAIDSGGLLAVIEHPNRFRYPGQKMMIVWIRKYVYVCPCIVSSFGDDKKVFMKTIFPSRKYKKLLLAKNYEKKN